MTYLDRRLALLDRLGDGPILVRGEGSDGTNSSFFYLTGIAESRAVLLLAREGVRINMGRAHPGPDYQRGRTVRQTLFLPGGDPLAARWGEASSATFETVSAADAGMDAVLGLHELDDVLGRALQSASVLHYVRAVPPTLSGPDDVDTSFVERVRRRFFGVTVRDATPVVHEMRRIKDIGEIEAIGRSIAVIAAALDRAFELVRPGANEYEIEAEITRVYRGRGGFHAFEPIVASGENALKLHYTQNSGPVDAGQLLLLDTGVSLEGYKGDISRTVPVDGMFSARQREVYETVLHAQEEAIALCRPGVLLGEVHARAFEIIDQAGFGSYFVHGTSHHLGLETHDAGDIQRPLATGCVITVEPGVYLPEEGLGVRIEDDILITEPGPRILSEAIPRTIEAIERRLSARHS